MKDVEEVKNNSKRIFGSEESVVSTVETTSTQRLTIPHFGSCRIRREVCRVGRQQETSLFRGMQQTCLPSHSSESAG